MYWLPGLILFFFLVNGSCTAETQSVHIHPALSKRILNLPFNSTLNHSASATATKIHNSSYSASARMVSYGDFHNTDNSTNTLPAPFYFEDPWGRHLRNYQHIMAGFCDLGDSFCSFRNKDGTKRTATPTSMDDMCVLWDDSCSGDKTKAIEKFFRSTVDLGGNSCFEHPPGGDSSACITYNPPSRLLEWQKIKQWMSSSQCTSALETYDELNGKNDSNKHRFWRSVSTCCLRCYIQAEDVDIYYWPEPDADTSCLSIIGGSVRPLDYGATTATVSVLHELTQTVDLVTYWGCTASTLKTETLSEHGHLTTFSYRETTTTAKITTIGSLPVKISAYNPWSPAPCPQEETATQVASSKIEPRAQNNSLVIPPSITQKNELPGTTVLDGYTL